MKMILFSKLRKAAGPAAASLLMCAVASSFQACDTKHYEDCPASRIIGSWGITNSTHAFGEYDSLYYIINPIVNVMDSIYFNGNYTDSYYHSDSTRVMLRYTVTDSIVFHFERMYAVQINPPVLLVRVKAEQDTTHAKCELKLKKDANSDRIYRCGPDSAFKNLLIKGGMLHFTATNGPSTSETLGSQNYEFVLNASGFKKALQMADSLNRPRLKADTTARRDSLKADSLKSSPRKHDSWKHDFRKHHPSR